MIAHLVLRVSDLEASRSFYGALGLDFVEERHGDGPRHYASAHGSTVLELYPRGRRAATTIRLGLRIPQRLDAEAVLRRLGCEPSIGEQALPITVHDPDGNVIDLVFDG